MERKLTRREFLGISAQGAAVAGMSGLLGGMGLPSWKAAEAAPGVQPFTFAYISDTHLYEKKLNMRFIRAIEKAIADVNAMDPQPDFVFFGGDLAQLGQKGELDIGKELLDGLRPKKYMMVGEHDWYLDMGDYWRELFGKDSYSFDHKGVHFIVLNSVIVEDYWTAPKLSPMERMKAMAQLDNPNGRPFTVGEAQREWLKKDLSKVPLDKPLIVFSHSPLYKYYKNWNFWTDDAEQVQALLAPFQRVSVVHAHTHQLLTNRIGNIHFHGVLSTAWPWPYGPKGLPRFTKQQDRADPFDQFDGCGWGTVEVLANGGINKNYNLWGRKSIQVSYEWLSKVNEATLPDPYEVGPHY
ncbi:MAG: metallophosphoesterase [candidate division NC10 bacterium]|nr:metallophosphoesterase [candidate division NC10 bacterium]